MTHLLATMASMHPGDVGIQFCLVVLTGCTFGWIIGRVANWIRDHRESSRREAEVRKFNRMVMETMK